MLLFYKKIKNKKINKNKMSSMALIFLPKKVFNNCLFYAIAKNIPFILNFKKASGAKF